MISKFKLTVSLSEELYAENLTKVDIAKSSKLKVYIPTVMSNTKKGDKGPGVYTLKTKGARVFANLGSQKPKISTTVLKAQNYLIATMTNGSKVLDIKNVVKEITKYLKTKDSNFNQKNISYVVKKDAPLNVKFLNGKLSKLTYNMSGVTNPDLSLKNPKKKKTTKKIPEEFVNVDSDGFVNDTEIIVDSPGDMSLYQDD